jgi:hypothetical protein
VGSMIVQEIVSDDKGVAILCPELDIYTCGDSMAQARLNLREALYEYYLYLLVHYHRLPESYMGHWHFLQNLLPLRMLSTLPGDEMAEVMRGLFDIAISSAEHDTQRGGYLRAAHALRDLAAVHPAVVRHLLRYGERTYSLEDLQSKPLYRDLYFLLANVSEEEGSKLEARRRALENRLANLLSERQQLSQDLQRANEQHEKYRVQLQELEKKKSAYDAFGEGEG